VEERIEKVIEVVRLKPGDLIKKGKLYAWRIHWDVYDFLSSLVFFNNQLCLENIVSLSMITWNREITGEEFSKRAHNVCKNANIETLEDLINFPGWGLINVPGCGLKTIQEFKDYIIEHFLVLSYVGPELPKAKTVKIAFQDVYTIINENQDNDIEDFKTNWNPLDVFD
jgi:hypothetical protein